MKRNHILDGYRGFTIISMVLFHLMYDINLYHTISWYNDTTINKLWQISIATSFFIISGVTSSFLTKQKNIKRGILVNILGIVITFATYIFAKDIMIVFGVLNGIGCCMIITGLIQGRIKNLPKIPMAIIMFFLFIATYSASGGTIFFGEIQLPEKLFEYNLFLLGFPSHDFYSTDYFGIVPWIFLYLAGFFKGMHLKYKNFYGKYGEERAISKIGKHSLLIYLIHQPILFGITKLLF